MKKITIALFSLFIMVGLSVNAQDQGEIRAGAGLALGTKAGVDENGSKIGIGINVGGEYFATDVISIAPSFTFFFPSEISGGGVTNKANFTSFNIDGRYYFGDGEIQFYGLAGLSFASTKTKVSGAGAGFDGTYKDSKTGLNLGGGLMYPMGDGMYLNGQIKYNTPIEQLVINAGISFNIGG